MELSGDIRALLDRANFVHVATVMADGAPHCVAVWAGRVDGDRVAFFTQPNSVKGRNLARDGRIALSVVDHDEPYKTATLRGHVVETRHGDAALAVMDELSIKHTGAPFPYRHGMLFVAEIDRARYTELPFERAPA